MAHHLRAETQVEVAHCNTCMHSTALTPVLMVFPLLLLQTYGNTTCEGDRGLTGVTQISSESLLVPCITMHSGLP
jgi:hypothetical protein